MRCSLLAMVTVLACACGEQSQAPPGDGPKADAPDASNNPYDLDRDRDGLCDATEAEFGSNPKRDDTDGDGLPDLIELANGFDATDSAQPTPDQVARLLAQPGSTLEFPVRVTIDGQGEGVVGRFVEMGSFYSDASSAQDFFVEALALSADPVDAVRRIDAEAARFRSVLGRTRLEFGLHFAYSPDTALPCARAYPFSYELESDSGAVLATGAFLLVVSPMSPDGSGVDDYCLPTDCQ